MGQPPRCNRTPSNSKPELFDQAERVAFRHVGQALRDMPFCSLPDLEQAAFSYLCQSLQGSGVAVREEYARRKAATWAAWWYRKHRDRRTPRTHTKYSPAQALRGRRVASMRKRNRNNWQALQVQLLRQGGGKVAEVAEQFGCTTRNIYKLSKRRFPKLVAVVLALGVNVPKSSVGSLPQKHGDTPKETLPAFTLGADRGRVWPATSPPLGETDEIDRLGLSIPDLLRAHWASSGT